MISRKVLFACGVLLSFSLLCFVEGAKATMPAAAEPAKQVHQEDYPEHEVETVSREDAPEMATEELATVEHQTAEKETEEESAARAKEQSDLEAAIHAYEQAETAERTARAALDPSEHMEASGNQELENPEFMSKDAEGESLSNLARQAADTTQEHMFADDEIAAAWEAEVAYADHQARLAAESGKAYNHEYELELAARELELATAAHQLELATVAHQKEVEQHRAKAEARELQLTARFSNAGEHADPVQDNTQHVENDLGTVERQYHVEEPVEHVEHNADHFAENAEKNFERDAEQDLDDTDRWVDPVEDFDPEVTARELELAEEESWGGDEGDLNPVEHEVDQEPLFDEEEADVDEEGTDADASEE